MFIALVWAVFGPVCPTGESQRRKVHAYEFRLQNSTAPLYGKREAARQAGPRRGPDRALPPPSGRVSASLSLDLVLSYMGTAAALTDALGQGRHCCHHPPAVGAQRAAVRTWVSGREAPSEGGG